ncbi:MAG: hypothetical protein H7836_17425, partial [Magnetococcus sp. YQC-3]
CVCVCVFVENTAFRFFCVKNNAYFFCLFFSARKEGRELGLLDDGGTDDDDEEPPSTQPLEDDPYWERCNNKILERQRRETAGAGSGMLGNSAGGPAGGPPAPPETPAQGTASSGVAPSGVAQPGTASFGVAPPGAAPGTSMFANPPPTLAPEHGARKSSSPGNDNGGCGTVQQVATRMHVRRALANPIMWPTCHIMDNKLLVVMKKPCFGEMPGLIFYYKNDNLPLEYNPTAIPLTAKGVREFLGTCSDFQKWIHQVNTVMDEHAQNRTTPSEDDVAQLWKDKPCDVFLEDSVSLPPATSAPDLRNKPLLAGAPGCVKLGCFLSQKFGLHPTVTLKFSECGGFNISQPFRRGKKPEKSEFCTCQRAVSWFSSTPSSPS